MGHLFANLASFDFLFVGLQVAVKVELSEETSLAVLTSESPLALVDLHMLVQIGFLGERVSAVREVAMVWPLLGVDPQMVEEVVPLPEHLVALAISAAEKSHDSTSLGALALIDDELLGAWDVLLDANLLQVIVLSHFDRDELLLVDDLSFGQVGIDIKVILFLNLSLGHFESC